MAERLRSAIEALFNVREHANALAASAEDRRRRRHEFVAALRSYGVPVLFLLAAAGLIAAAAHFLVWSLVTHIVMPLIYAGVPDLKAVTLGESSVLVGQFIGYVLYAACMIGLAVLGVRAMLAKPQGYVHERTKTCPDCGMTVLQVATRCRFCGTSLPGRRSYGPLPASRGPAPTYSSSRSSSRDDEGAPRSSRRGRRGGRRRSGRSRPDGARPPSRPEGGSGGSGGGTRPSS